MPRTPARHPLSAFLLALASVVLLAGAAAAPARAAYSVNVTSAQPTGTTAAGAFADFALTAEFPQDSTPRSLAINLPVGQLGALSSVATCSTTSFNADSCAAPTQIGTTTVTAEAPVIGQLVAPGSVYLIPTTGTEIGRIGIVVRPSIGNKMFIEGTLRTRDDYGIVAAVDTLPNSASLTIIPGLPPAPIGITVKKMVMTMFGRVGGTGAKGFFFNPTTCTPATTVIRSTAYDGSTASGSASYTPTACASAPFTPTVKFDPASTAASTPTTFTVDVGHPFDPLAAKVGSPFRETAIVLPPGVQLTGSTNSDGQLVACSDAQFAYANLGPSSCPAGSKVGTVNFDSPLVGDVPGDVYLAQPAPGTGDLIRLFIVAQRGPQADALRVKLLTRVTVDPATGLLTNTLVDLPNQPVRSFRFTFRAGTAPGVRQPRTCGTFTGSASLTSYASATPARLTAPYVVDSGCDTAGRFRPTIGMTASPTTAGAPTTGTTTIDLPVGDEPITGVTASLPPGMLANLRGVARCTLTQAAADACPAGTQIGTVRALAGQSSVPGTFDGTIALTDAPPSTPGAIAGLFVRVPVVVGPIVVDTLKIQGAIRLRPDYGIDVISTIPDTVRGLQLDQQKLTLVFDRANFMLNPPVCSGNAVTGAFTSAQGTARTASSPVTVTGCDAMAFTPSVSFSASPASATAASALTTTLTLPASSGAAVQAPVRSAAVTLPEGVSLSASAGAGGDLVGCTDAQFKAGDFSDPTCPAGSAVGTVTIETPTVGRLSGSAYLADAAPGHLARLLIDARSDDFGAAARVKLEGAIDVDPATGRTTASFDGLPPVGFTSFSLTMRGGSKPVLAMPRACGTTTGSVRATPWAGGAAKTASAPLTISQDCPPTPAAFTPTLDLSRSTTAAGRSITFGTTVSVPAGEQALTSMELALPSGLLGAISSVPACSASAGAAGTCPAASRVGTISAKVGVASAPFTVTGGAFLVEGTATSIARLALVLPAKVGPIDLGEVVTLADLRLRGDYGLDVVAPSIPTQVKGVRLDLHEFSLSIDRPDFMVNPVTCDTEPVTASFGGSAGGTQLRSRNLTTDGCDGLALDTSLGFGAAPASPATASAVTTRIRATAAGGRPLDAMKRVQVALPEGVSLSPSAGARGDLAECTATQFAPGDIGIDAACPAGSKVGSVALTSPMVGDLAGEVYLGPKTGDHFAGVFFQATAPAYPSLRVKVEGTIDVDPATGRLTAAFENLPPVQVSAIDLTLRGDDAPILSLPRTCGTFGATVAIDRFGGGPRSTADGALELSADCPDPAAFAPTLGLGVSTAQAAADTALSTVISVPARQAALSSLAVTMPRGLLGRLTVVPQCPLDDARAGACSEASQVGTVTAKVGVATAPFTVQGKVFMTAGSADAIAGLAFVLPAKVGPIDLGNVITLAKLKIEGPDLQLRIVADAVPTRVRGIPLGLGQLAVAIDHPGVVLNASSCEARSAVATFGSEAGASAGASAPYAATGCERLDWQPKMDLMFTGAASELVRGGHPTVRTVIEQREGQGNLRGADVLLPSAVSTDLANINASICESAAAAAAGTCPAKAVAGTAEIITSALPEPVDAPIFIVRIPGQPLPGLAIRVRDQIAFDVVGSTKVTAGGRIRVQFDGLPDTPISRMTLVFAGGAKGLIQLNGDVCNDEGTTTIGLTAQHGAQRALELATNCNGRVANPLAGRTAAGGATAKLAIRPTGKRRGYTLSVANKSGIRRVTFTMPKGFSYSKQARKHLTVKATGAGKAKVKMTRKIKGRTLTISVASAKVTGLSVTAKPKAATFTKAYAKALRRKATQKKVKPTLTILDATAKPLTPKATLTFAKK